MEAVYVILLILAISSRGILGQEGELISNVNFGSFLTYTKDVVNSGSTWTHTFLIEELFEDPIPKNVRADITLSDEGCLAVANAFTERSRLRENGVNVSIDRIRETAVSMCNDVLSVSRTLNQQKNLLIAGIDRDVQSIRNFVYDDADLRDGKQDYLREKRSPADIVGIIGEKLFGIGRKQAVDLAHDNIETLKKQTNRSLNALLANQQSMQSVVRSQDKVIHSMSKALHHQQEEVHELIREVAMTKTQLDYLERISVNDIMFVYNLISHQHGLQTSLIKATISVLGNLQIMKDRTREILTAFQKLASGYLPVELVPADAVQNALEKVDNMLLRPRLQFHLAIRSVRYYYGMQCASYVTQGKLSIVLRIPLATVGAVFKAYSVNAIKIPFTSVEGDGNENRYTRVGGFAEYFAMSLDGEYYLEMTHKEMMTCNGIDGFPAICNPVIIMNSVRAKPSCTLSLYQGNATMMSEFCDKEYYEQTEPDSQVYQVGANQILITAVEGQFIKHCAHGQQMVTVPACRLCLMKLPCGCNLKSRDVLVPPLLDGCNNNQTEDKVDFAMNLLLASQLMNQTELMRFNGSMTFETVPEMHVPTYSVQKFNHETIVELETNVMDLEKVIQLAKVDEDIYLDDESYLATPKTLSEKISAMKFSGAIQVILAGMNLVALALGFVAYKKGCTSMVTSTAALQGIPPTKADGIHEDGYLDAAMSETELYWMVLKPYIYVYLTYLMLRLVIKTIQITHEFLSTRLLIAPLEGMPAKSETTHVYLSISNGEETVRIYVYTIDVTYHGMTLIQRAGSQIEIGRIPKWPANPWAYSVPITNHSVLLKTVKGDKLKLPGKVRVPIIIKRKLARVISKEYTTELCVGNGLFRVLTPECYEVGDPFVSESTLDYGSRTESNFTIIDPERAQGITSEARTNCGTELDAAPTTNGPRNDHKVNSTSGTKITGRLEQISTAF